MRTAVWIGIGWLGVVFFAAVSTRLGWAHVVPDMSIVVLVFLAMRREPMSLVTTAAMLGYLVGRQALAPVGLHEAALVATALAVYLAAGNLVGSGGLFFVMASGAATVGYHALVFALVWWQRGQPGFSSWATASLVPSGLATAAVALICHPFMLRLERRLTQDKREGLSWR